MFIILWAKEKGRAGGEQKVGGQQKRILDRGNYAWALKEWLQHKNWVHTPAVLSEWRDGQRVTFLSQTNKQKHRKHLRVCTVIRDGYEHHSCVEM